MIIERYLIRQILAPFLAILAILAALFGGFSAAGILGDAVEELLPSGMIAAMIGLKLLIALEVLIPISLYLAVVLAFGRLHGESEFPAMFALGVSPARVMRAVLLLSGCIAALVAALSLTVRPWAYRETHELSRRAGAALDLRAMQPGIFYVADGGNRVIFLARRTGPDTARQVFVLIRRPDRTTIIAARRADALSGAAGADAELQNAHVYEIGHGGQADRSLLAGRLVLDPHGKPGPAWYSPVSAGTARLAASSRPEDVAELQWRLSTGVSCLLLAMLGMSLTSKGPRQGRYARLGTAILVYSIYYLLCSAARSLVQTGAVPSLPGLWWAPGLLALALLVLNPPRPGRVRRRLARMAP